MKNVFLFLLLSVSFSVQGQSAEDSVKAVINQMFNAMLQADGKMLSECFADSAILQTIDTRKGVVVRSQNISNFIKQISSLQPDVADERITFKAIHIDGDLASVWTPYQFYYKGSFSHCGVNSFQLVRINGSWKIHYLIDTRRKEGCL